MGWKRIKEHYGIIHIVQVTKEGICIGSPYIHNIIVIGLDGKIIKSGQGSPNEDLRRYQREMDADPDLLRRLATEQDQHLAAITVFTYEGGKIIEKLCDEPGWPNVTHDGSVMYENTYSTDKTKVIEWAKQNAKIGIKYSKRNVGEARLRLEECKERLRAEKACLAMLNADFP